MDNVTHALAGLLVAELASSHHARQHGARPAWRGPALLVSALAQNLPDLDFLLLRLTPGPLGYLMQHRGYTHTLLAVLPLALLALAPAWAWARLRPGTLDAAGWRRLVALAVVGGLFHIGMDGTNDYGVHPFWPWDPRWFYGDTIFIIEPLLWASAIPALTLAAETRVARIVLPVLLGAVLVLAGVARDMVRAPTPLVVVALAALVFVLARRQPRERRAAVGALAWVAVTLTFAVASHLAAERVRARLAAAGGGAVLRDLGLTAAPADPLCWRAIAVTTTTATYALTVHAVSLWPAGVAPEQCPHTEGPTTAPARRLDEPAVDGVLPLRRFTAPLASWQALATRCDVATFLRWSRLPFWVERERDLVVGDLRYDRDPGLSFAELALSLGPPADCPRGVPSWAPPRAGDVAAPITAP